MLFITGDTHIPIDISKLNTENFPMQRTLTKNDYVLICGDFGGVWNNSNEEKYWLKWLTEKNFTTLFIDGNHENFDLLSTYPIVNMFNGLVTEITSSVFHLKRGQIYNIADKSIFTMGGATSTDKHHRKEGVSWWPQEIPSYQEWGEAFVNLETIGNKVDIIISHAAPTSLLYSLFNYVDEDAVTRTLDIIKNVVDYKQWFFGHYHVDENIDDKHIAVYNKIISIGE